MRLWPFVLALAASSPATATEPTASPERMTAHMSVLAAPGMAGRRPGGAGEAQTVAYLAAAFESAGLTPGYKGGWRQPVALEERTPRRSKAVFQAAEQVLDLGEHVRLTGRTEREVVVATSVAFGGHATAEALPSLSDAVVIYRDSDTPGRSPPEATDTVSRAEALAAAGAKAVLAIVPDAVFETQTRRRAPGVISEPNPPFAMRGMISETAARRLLQAVGADLAALDLAAGRPGFVARRFDIRADLVVETEVRSFVSHNVVGVIPGTKRPEETIVFTAHWDGLGACRPREVDPICHGAVDNGSGVGGLIELARMFAGGVRPDRTLVFVATSAEEYGLLGARAYARDPVGPLAWTVAALNIDTMALHPRGHAVGFVGAGFTTADAMIAEEAARQGRSLDTGGITRFVLKNSDAWAMMRAGVPAFILSGAIASSGPDGGRGFRAFVDEVVHTPGDNLSRAIDMSGAAEDVDLAYRIARRISDADFRLEFLPRAPFSRPPR